jgi:hypothetical protein
LTRKPARVSWEYFITMSREDFITLQYVAKEPSLERDFGRKKKTSKVDTSRRNKA